MSVATEWRKSVICVLKIRVKVITAGSKNAEGLTPWRVAQEKMRGGGGGGVKK